MAFPIGPANGATTTVNGISYIYDSAANKWTRTLNLLANISLVGNITSANANIYTKLTASLGAIDNLYVTNGLFWANGISIPNTSGGGGGGYPPTGSQGQLQFNDAGALGATTVYYDTASGNLVVTDTTTSTTTTTGALVVKGGLGVAGNVYTDTLYTTTGLRWAGNNAVIPQKNYTVSTTPPVSATNGDQWYNPTNDVLYDYLSDGTSSYWVDLQSASVSADIVPSVISTGNLTVTGETRLLGNVTLGNTISTLKGSVAYLFESANVVVGSPPAIMDFNIDSSTVLYWTSNAITNMTANIRGNAITPLNSILGVGQSATIAIIIPQATAYYITSVAIDNTLTPVVWQSAQTVTSGNANSIDIYSYTIIKTAASTFKVFASRSFYQHTG